MPADYICPRCHLAFSVGWFHYHSFESGYDGMLLLACKTCGTPHSVEHAIDPEYLDSMCEEINPEWLLHGPPKDRLCASQEPVFAVRDQSKEFQVPGVVWIVPWTAPFLEEVGQDALAEIPCHYCEGENTLVSEWPEKGAPCPACGQHIDQPVSFWIT